MYLSELKIWNFRKYGLKMGFAYPHSIFIQYDLLKENRGKKGRF
jgi:hypothetical protein